MPIMVGSAMNTPKLKKLPRKTYIPIKIQTNAINKDDIAINAAYISIEDLTSEDNRKKARERARTLEVRYLDNIRTLRDKIKSSYSCNKEQCPAAKERLVQHQLKHHSSVPNPCQRLSQTLLKVTDDVQLESIHLASTEPHIRTSVQISGKPPILKRNNPKETDHQSIQTTANNIDFCHTTQSNDKELFKNVGHTNLSLETDNVKPKETKISFTSKNCIMRDDLQHEIMTWYEDIPVDSNLNPSPKNSRRNLINDFIDKIYTYTNEENTNDSYESKVKREIEDLLNVLPILYPDAKQDQEILKDTIKNNLLNNIRDLRSKMYDKSVDVQTDEVDNATAAENQFDREQMTQLIENEILDWVMQIKFRESKDIGRTVKIIETTDTFTRRLMPLLDRPTFTRNHKLILKGLILDTLNDLPNVFQYPKDKRVYLNHIAEELANRILYIQIKCRKENNCDFSRDRKLYQMSVYNNSVNNESLIDGLDYCCGNNQLYPRLKIIEDVTDILLDCIDSMSYEGIRKDKLSDIKQNLMMKSDIRPPINVSNTTEQKVSMSQMYNSNTVTVFKSEHDLSRRSSDPVTSTPKRKVNKNVLKQNPEEIDYTNKVSEIIREWMKTLPKNFDDDENFKDTAVMDLAGDIIDELKTEQLLPMDPTDKTKLMYYTIFRWLYRFDIFEDELPEEIPQIRDLQNRLDQIPIPILTRPRHDGRQIMATTKKKESDREFYVPKDIDIFRDEISNWVNEQQSDIYSKREKDRNKMIQDLAKSLQSCLKSKATESGVNRYIDSWMNKMLKSSEKENIEKLSEALKSRIFKLLQDNTLLDNFNKKTPCKLVNPEQGAANISTTTTFGSFVDSDRTMKEFIAKYMELNYDVDDTIAREAFTELLKKEIRKLSPPTRNEVYENFTKLHDDVAPERLDKELDYIKIVSDWLKNIPIDSSFNTPNNKKRIEFVNDLARKICEVEEERYRAPKAMDYDKNLARIVSKFTNELPLPPESQGDVPFMIGELIGKVTQQGSPMPCCENYTSSSINTSGIPEQNLSEFIHNYIHLNAAEFADDPMKMDAWTARVMEEVKKIIQNTADPSTLCKTQVYSKLMSVPIPEEETVRLFGLELSYAKEISDWMKNMPLLYSPTQEPNNGRVKMISELAEKFSEMERKKITGLSEPENEIEMEEFITHWIKRLPLELNKEINIPILIKQLLRRLEKVNQGTEGLTLQTEIKDVLSPIKSNKSQSKINKSRSKTQKCRQSCCSSSGQPGQVMVETIENWSNNLPVKSDNKKLDKTIKSDVAKKLYQKIGNLSVDPQIMNDDNLFQELFTEEVNAQLNNLPQISDVEKKKDALKSDLVDKVMEAKSIVQEAVAGDNYKLQLEKTIEASIPTPITNRQCYDPGFEIYKNRLADLFILENFDHGNDAVKIKYERKIRDALDKYFQSALNRNAILLSKDEIYNKLYSALFKVPIPNRASAIAQVEEVKTRCEIEIWFQGLPLREASGLNELLERDQIISMLAKRLHAIETSEKNPDEKMHKEIAKWLVKFPLIQGQENNVDQFAKELLESLKTSKENRKCFTIFDKRKEINESSKRKQSMGNESQIVGPSNKTQLRKRSNDKSQLCCQVSEEQRKKPAEVALQIVESWCEQLPLPQMSFEDAINNKIIRDNLLTQIIIKICALNGNPETFNDTILYEHFLDAELESLISEIPLCCQSEQTKRFEKTQLVKAILSLLPMMREEKACYEYKQELETTIDQLLQKPLDTTAEKIAEFNQLKEEIVDNFVQYYYSRDADEGRQIYKENLHEILSKYLQDIRDKADDTPVDPLIKQNQLLCELAKVPIPTERVIKDKVEEIKIKNEVNKFFDELKLPKESADKMALRNTIKLSLAKRLHQLQVNGHNCENDSKMKKEIERYLKKINMEVGPDKIVAFITKLNNRETITNSPPIENKADNSSKHHGSHTQSENSEIPNREQSFAFTKNDVNRKSEETRRIQSEDIEIQTPLSFHPKYPCNYRNESGSMHSSSFFRDPINKEDPTSNRLRYSRDQLRNRTHTPSSEEEDRYEDCKCEQRMKRRYRGRPRCVLQMDDYCEECEQYRRMWLPCRMPPPRYYYY